ncbi:MAG: type II toxin-antitoxin system HicB family antitoxin [Candidatus Sigynarchaeota archaeon]
MLKIYPHDNKATMMGQTCTAIFEQVPEGDIAFVQEIPGVNTHGETLDTARDNGSSAQVSNW